MVDWWIEVLTAVYARMLYAHPITFSIDYFSQVTLQDQQRETAILAKRLGLAAKENEDLAQYVVIIRGR